MVESGEVMQSFVPVLTSDEDAFAFPDLPDS